MGVEKKTPSLFDSAYFAPDSRMSAGSHLKNRFCQAGTEDGSRSFIAVDLHPARIVNPVVPAFPRVQGCVHSSPEL